MPTEPRKPQDRKPKTAKPTRFSFEGADGEVYHLPPPTDLKLTGRMLRDVALGGDDEKLAFGFRALEAVDPDPAALDALYDLEVQDTLAVIDEWLRKAREDGVSVPSS